MKPIVIAIAKVEYFETACKEVLLKRVSEYSSEGALRSETFELVVDPAIRHTLLANTMDRYHDELLKR